MIAMIIFLFCVLVALGTGLFAAYSDIQTMTIPNIYSLILLGAFIPAYASVYFSGVDVFGPLTHHLGAFAITLVISFLLYRFNVIGGGDSKLLAAYSIWVGFAGLIALLFYMSVLGAVLGGASLYIQKKQPFKEPKENSWIAHLQGGKSHVPYGVPIVFGAFIAFLLNGYLDLDTLKGFLGV